MKGKLAIQDMAHCAIFTVLIIVGAYIKIPVPAVPFTMQFFFTNLAGILLGSKKGAISTFTYLLLGIIGVPVFTAGGGPAYVFVPSFGYIIGFVFGAYAAGLIVEKMKKDNVAKYLAAGFTNLFIVYFMGMIYYYIISNYVIDTPIGLWPLFLYCFLLVVPGDITLCILTALSAKRLRKAFTNGEN